MLIGQPYGKLVVNNWQVDRSANLPVVVAAALGRDKPVNPVVISAARNDVDGASGGVAPVQRALRALQDLNSVDIEERTL